MTEESRALPNALELASDLEDDNFRGNTTQIVNIIRHLAEDYEVSRRDYEVMYQFYTADSAENKKEKRRQKLLEQYGIGVMQLLYTGDKGMWFGAYQVHGDEYETDNYKTRREAEDKAIAEYESISETGEK